MFPCGISTPAEQCQRHHWRAHNPESHLIPLILQVPNGKREAISIYGTDYDTPDGTCIRDYIHVTDLAQAHILAVQYLQNGGEAAFSIWATAWAILCGK